MKHGYRYTASCTKASAIRTNGLYRGTAHTYATNMHKPFLEKLKETTHSTRKAHNSVSGNSSRRRSDVERERTEEERKF